MKNTNETLETFKNLPLDKMVEASKQINVDAFILKEKINEQKEAIRR